MKNIFRKLLIHSTCFSLCFLFVQMPVYAFGTSSGAVTNSELIAENDGQTLALYHFDGDGKDSSYWKNSDALLGSGVFADGKFGKGAIVAPGEQIEIFLQNELDVKNFTLEMTLLNSSDDITDVYFMIEDTVLLRNDSLIKNGVNSLVFQGGDYDIDLSRLPMSNVFFDMGSASVSSGFRVNEDYFMYMGISFGLCSDTVFYKNGARENFSLENSDTCSVRCDYIIKANGQISPIGGSNVYRRYYDLVGVRKSIHNIVEDKTGIYIFKDSIVIKNTSSQSVVLDELRISNVNLYSGDTISVPDKPFDVDEKGLDKKTEMESVTGAVGTVLEMTVTLLIAIINNPVLVVMLAFGFVGAGIVVFKKLINVTAKN